MTLFQIKNAMVGSKKRPERGVPARGYLNSPMPGRETMENSRSPSPASTSGIMAQCTSTATRLQISLRAEKGVPARGYLRSPMPGRESMEMSRSPSPDSASGIMAMCTSKVTWLQTSFRAEKGVPARGYLKSPMPGRESMERSRSPSPASTSGILAKCTSKASKLQISLRAERGVPARGYLKSPMPGRESMERSRTPSPANSGGIVTKCTSKATRLQISFRAEKGVPARGYLKSLMPGREKSRTPSPASAGGILAKCTSKASKLQMSLRAEKGVPVPARGYLNSPMPGRENMGKSRTPPPANAGGIMAMCTSKATRLQMSLKDFGRSLRHPGAGDGPDDPENYSDFSFGWKRGQRPNKSSRQRCSTPHVLPSPWSATGIARPYRQLMRLQRRRGQEHRRTQKELESCWRDGEFSRKICEYRRHPERMYWMARPPSAVRHHGYFETFDKHSHLSAANWAGSPAVPPGRRTMLPDLDGRKGGSRPDSGVVIAGAQGPPNTRTPSPEATCARCTCLGAAHQRALDPATRGCRRVPCAHGVQLCHAQLTEAEAFARWASAGHTSLPYNRRPTGAEVAGREEVGAAAVERHFDVGGMPEVWAENRRFRLFLKG